MRNLAKFLLATLLLTMVSSFQAFGQSMSSVNADVVSACPTSGNMTAVDGSCRATPTKYGITIYEMGLCASHPYGAAKDAATFDSSTCVVTYSDPTASEVDLAASIGGVSPLTGTSTAPTPGTYKFPYIVMGSSFTVSGEITHDTFGTLRSNGSSGSNGVSVIDQTDSLVQFGNSASTCYSGYLGAAVTGGVIDGFIANTSLARGATATAGVCDTRGRVVGVMTLATPVPVTPKTYSVVFNFLLTDNGVQWSDEDSTATDAPEGFGSAPFAGYFVIKNAD
jgi:hypothetical protein